MYRAFSARSIGANHIKHNKVCQDFAFHVNRADFSIALVADGHGSDDYFRSDRGSRYAGDSAFQCITEFIGSVQKEYPRIDEVTEKEWDRLLGNLEKSIIRKWHEKVDKDYAGNPFTEEDVEMEKVSEKHKQRYLKGEEVEHAYGTTLIAVAVTDSYWFGLHIGDGKCVVLYPDGTDAQPIPWDPACFLNSTTSICDADAANRFRHYFCSFTTEPKPVAVFVGSDGIDDSYPLNDNEKHLAKLYNTITLNFAAEGFDAGVQQLRDFLPTLTDKGSGDDVSISGFIDMDVARQMKERKDAKDAVEKEAPPVEPVEPREPKSPEALELQDHIKFRLSKMQDDVERMNEIISEVKTTLEPPANDE
jgi:hypothetical protein